MLLQLYWELTGRLQSLEIPGGRHAEAGDGGKDDDQQDDCNGEPGVDDTRHHDTQHYHPEVLPITTYAR